MRWTLKQTCLAGACVSLALVAMPHCRAGLLDQLYPSKPDCKLPRSCPAPGTDFGYHTTAWRPWAGSGAHPQMQMQMMMAPGYAPYSSSSWPQNMEPYDNGMPLMPGHPALTPGYQTPAYGTQGFDRNSYAPTPQQSVPFQPDRFQETPIPGGTEFDQSPPHPVPDGTLPSLPPYERMPSSMQRLPAPVMTSPPVRPGIPHDVPMSRGAMPTPVPLMRSPGAEGNRVILPPPAQPEPFAPFNGGTVPGDPGDDVVPGTPNLNGPADPSVRWQDGQPLQPAAHWQNRRPVSSRKWRVMPGYYEPQQTAVGSEPVDVLPPAFESVRRSR